MKIKIKKRMRRWLIGISVVILFFVWLQNVGIHYSKKYREGQVEIQCVPVFGWVTKSDRVDASESHPFKDLQPGDILLSLSTHTMGWRHGHAGLVLDESHVLECSVIGKDSTIVSINQWREYSNYVVLRVKNVSEEEQKAVVDFAREYLLGKPYRLSAGIGREKAPDVDNRNFGMHCAYLVWYAWYQMGYDIDSDGGRVVTVRDILDSDAAEAIQVYGLNLK
jgi:uncharacterized protein YycO